MCVVRFSLRSPDDLPAVSLVSAGKIVTRVVIIHSPSRPPLLPSPCSAPRCCNLFVESSHLPPDARLIAALPSFDLLLIRSCFERGIGERFWCKFEQACRVYVMCGRI